MTKKYLIADIKYTNFTVYLLDSYNNRINKFTLDNCSQQQAGDFLKNIHCNYKNNTDIEYTLNLDLIRIN